MKKLYLTLSLILGITAISCNTKEESKTKLKPTSEMSEVDKELDKEMDALDKDVEELDTLAEILKH